MEVNFGEFSAHAPRTGFLSVTDSNGHLYYYVPYMDNKTGQIYSSFNNKPEEICLIDPDGKYGGDKRLCTPEELDMARKAGNNSFKTDSYYGNYNLDYRIPTPEELDNALRDYKEREDKVAGKALASSGGNFYNIPYQGYIVKRMGDNLIVTGHEKPVNTTSQISYKISIMEDGKVKEGDYTPKEECNVIREPYKTCNQYTLDSFREVATNFATNVAGIELPTQEQLAEFEREQDKLKTILQGFRAEKMDGVLRLRGSKTPGDIFSGTISYEIPIMENGKVKAGYFAPKEECTDSNKPFGDDDCDTETRDFARRIAAEYAQAKGIELPTQGQLTEAHNKYCKDMPYSLDCGN